MTATLRQIAVEAGVSISTVSRAFSAPHRLLPETVERIHEVARRLDYVPNRMARALKSGRTSNVGLVVPDITNPFFPPLIKAAQRRARHLGYCLFLADSGEDPDEEAHILRSFSHQLDGVVLCGTRMTEQAVRGFAQDHATVLVNRKIDGLPSILIDSTTGIRQAVDHLADLGHRRIAYLAGPHRSWSNWERRKAVTSQARERGVELSVIGPLVPTHESGKQSADDVINSAATGVIAFDDVLAGGLMAGLSGRGCRVPGDISIIGCDDVTAESTHPQLASITGKCVEAGHTAMETLHHIIDDDPEEVPEQPIVFPTELVLRSSTAPPPARKRRKDAHAKAST